MYQVLIWTVGTQMQQWPLSQIVTNILQLKTKVNAFFRFSKYLQQAFPTEEQNKEQYSRSQRLCYSVNAIGL